MPAWVLLPVVSSGFASGEGSGLCGSASGISLGTRCARRSFRATCPACPVLPSAGLEGSTAQQQNPQEGMTRKQAVSVWLSQKPAVPKLFKTVISD